LFPQVNEFECPSGSQIVPQLKMFNFNSRNKHTVDFWLAYDEIFPHPFPART
jgi:hypothetical protein